MCHFWSNLRHFIWGEIIWDHKRAPASHPWTNVIWGQQHASVLTNQRPRISAADQWEQSRVCGVWAVRRRPGESRSWLFSWQTCLLQPRQWPAVQDKAGAFSAGNQLEAGRPGHQYLHASDQCPSAKAHTLSMRGGIRTRASTNHSDWETSVLLLTAWCWLTL